MPSKVKLKKSEPQKKKAPSRTQQPEKHGTESVVSAPTVAASIWVKNSGKIFRLVSILLVFAILLGLIRLFIPLFWAPLVTGVYPLNYPLRLSPDRPTISLYLGEPDWTSDYPTVSIDYDGKVELSQKLLWEKGGCFRELFLMAEVNRNAFSEPIRYGRGSSPEIYLNPGTCFDADNKKLYVSSEQWIYSGVSSPRISGIPPYYYPFDWGELNVRLYLIGEENTESFSQLKNIPVNITGNVNAKNWDVQLHTTDKSTSTQEGNIYVSLNVQYKRPLIYRVIPSVLLVMILSIIIYLPFIKDNSSFLEVLIGLIFGIWGIKQVIIPTFVTWTTILEPIILGLYMCLCVSVFVKFILTPLQAKIDKFSKGENG